MTKDIPIRTAAAIYATLAIFHAVLLFGVAGENELAAVLGVGLILFLVIPPRISFLLSTSFLLATLLLAGMVSLTGLDKSLFPNPVVRLIDYDPLRGHQVFRADQDLSFTIPFGDIKAMTLAEMDGRPKEVRFITDHLGYRNTQDYSGQPYVIVGDSFAVSSSTTQADIPSERLRRAHGIKTYTAAAVGGDMQDYVIWSEHFRANVNAEVKFIIFVFEGNDFHAIRSLKEDRPLWRMLTRRYRDTFRFMPLGRYAFTQYNRLRAKSGGVDPAVIGSAAGRRLAFFRPYVETVRRKDCPDLGLVRNLLARLAPNTAAVYFIPAKYRVYAPLLDDPETDLPTAQWDRLSRLCAELELPCFDLGPALAAEAGTALAEGQLVWYSDDTHWNARGIAAAMKVVAATLPGVADAPGE